MRGQHLTVGINVNACPCRLLQEHFKIAQVVAGNQNARILPHAEIDFRNFGIAVSLGIRRVEKRHRVDAPFARFQRQRGQRVRAEGIVKELRQRFLREGVDVRVLLAQRVRVLHVRGKSLQSVSNQFPQAADILVFRTEHADRLRLFRKIVPQSRPHHRVGQV